MNQKKNLHDEIAIVAYTLFENSGRLHGNDLGQVAEVAPTLRPLVGEGTVVVPLQKGVEAAGVLSPRLGAERVAGGLCHVFAWREGPGEVRTTGVPLQMTLGEIGGPPSPRLARLAAAIRDSGAGAVLADDVVAAAWEKFLFIDPFGSVGAVTRAPLGVTRSEPRTRAMLVAAVEEVAAIARARGVALPADAVARTLARYDELPTEATASMQRDVVAGRPSELHEQAGAVVRLGEARRGRPRPPVPVRRPAATGGSGAKRAVAAEGGPAGSIFSYFLLDMAERSGLKISVDIYEPRDFDMPGSTGCNMCGGVLYESLVQSLALEGINLPESVVQRGIEYNLLHFDIGSVGIQTPRCEKRIATTFRGIGPRGLMNFSRQSLDGFLLNLAVNKGACHIRGRVDDVRRSANPRSADPKDELVQVKTAGGEFRTYALVAVATGVNTAVLNLFREMDFGDKPPRTAKLLAREYYLGEEEVSRCLGSAFHAFLLDIPGLDYGAIIPKAEARARAGGCSWNLAGAHVCDAIYLRR